MSFPKAAGGKGGGQNPEQLFAMGYSCEKRLAKGTPWIHTDDLPFAQHVSWELYKSLLPSSIKWK